LRPRRARCGRCLITHVLLPVTVLVRRAYAAEVIGAAVLARAGGSGHRAIGATRELPATTVRGWLRVMGARLEPVRRHLLQVAVRAGVDVRVPEALGCPWRDVLAASVDDFHRPRAERYRRGRDSPIGFWLDSYDYDRFRRELLDPLSPGGDGVYRRKVHDLFSDQPVAEPPQSCPPGAVLVVDGLFLHRDVLRGYWDFSVWLEVPFAVTAARMVHRDGTSPDPNDPSMARYVAGQRLYFAKCGPARRAAVVIDNTDPERPAVVTV